MRIGLVSVARRIVSSRPIFFVLFRSSYELIADILIYSETCMNHRLARWKLQTSRNRDSSCRHFLSGKVLIFCLSLLHTLPAVVQRAAGSDGGANFLSGERGSLAEHCRTPQEGETPLHLASKLGQEAAVETLLAAGVDKEATNIVRGDMG